VLGALFAGARVTFPAGKLGAEGTARALMERSAQGKLTVFMAVPTIYAQVLAWLRKAGPGVQAEFAQAVNPRTYRLMVSGSAALPAPILRGWEAATGNGLLLLERYGMSEAGMILSQPLDEAKRRSMGKSVGQPLPGVQVKVEPVKGDEEGSGKGEASDAARAAASSSSAGKSKEVVGSLLIRGPGVFREYWRRPDKTSEEFDSAGWFKTGDVVSVTPDSNGQIEKVRGHRAAQVRRFRVARRTRRVGEEAHGLVPGAAQVEDRQRDAQKRDEQNQQEGAREAIRQQAAEVGHVKGNYSTLRSPARAYRIPNVHHLQCMISICHTLPCCIKC